MHPPEIQEIGKGRRTGEDPLSGESEGAGRPTGIEFGPVLPPGRHRYDPVKKDLDPVGFALSRVQTFLVWIDEHRAAFEKARGIDPETAESELSNLRDATEQGLLYMQRLSELILAGYAIDPGKRLPDSLRRGWFASYVGRTTGQRGVPGSEATAGKPTEATPASYQSTRRFRLWDYNVSHDQMLLRSPRTPEIETNIDIVIWGVEYLDLASTLDGVELAPASGEDLHRAERSLGRKLDRPSEAFCLISGGRRSLVVAAGFMVLENTLDLFESSLESFAGTDPARDLGTVLAHSKDPAARGTGLSDGLEDGATSLRLPEPSSSA